MARCPGRSRQLELSPQSDIRHPLFARMYVRFVGRSADRDQNRVHLLDGLSGRVLELGCGSGTNFPRYPPTVTELIAIEPEPYMREHAEQAAKSAPVPVRVLAADADHLPLGDESVDAAVCSLVLCSVPDQAGFPIERCDRLMFPKVEFPHPHILGRAQRPPG